jgi:hypothetical protein
MSVAFGVSVTKLDQGSGLRGGIGKERRSPPSGAAVVS